MKALSNRKEPRETYTVKIFFKLVSKGIKCYIMKWMNGNEKSTFIQRQINFILIVSMRKWIK